MTNEEANGTETMKAVWTKVEGKMQEKELDNVNWMETQETCTENLSAAHSTVSSIVLLMIGWS